MSTTNARTNITDFTSDEIEASEHKSGAIFLSITGRCDIMLGQSASTAEDVAREIAALRKLAEVAKDVASQLETRQIRRDGDALGRRIAADEGIEPKADRVPWPTGLCGHPVPPGAWHTTFTICRDCIADRAPEMLATFDEAAAPNLTVVDDAARPEDDADGES